MSNTLPHADIFRFAQDDKAKGRELYIESLEAE